MKRLTACCMVFLFNYHQLALQKFNHLSIIVVAALVLLTCSCGGNNQSADSQDGKTDIVSFIVTEVAKCGGIDKTDSISSNQTQVAYQFIRDKYGFQVFCSGDRVADLATLFQTIYGPPKLARTNSAGNASFNYSIDQVGVAIDCGVAVENKNGAQKKLTHLVVVRASALRGVYSDDYFPK